MYGKFPRGTEDQRNKYNKETQTWLNERKLKQRKKPAIVPEKDQVKSTKYTSETIEKFHVDLKYRMCTQVEVQANRIDGRVIDKVKKEVILIETSCPWMGNPQMKTEEKNAKVWSTQMGTQAAIFRI